MSYKNKYKYKKCKYKYIQLKYKDIMNDIIDLANNAHGYINIFDQIINIVIFRGCHTYWKDLLKNIIEEEINKKSHNNNIYNKIKLLKNIRKQFIDKLN
uniref:Uncharacterized protein n=1 Tax=Mimivirus LCMiAC02 TaxID=2506609 RepID=A0A481Z1F4_9VIRU|nr:MAG: hypothetical protein LCMiAC02_05780 [Mimivirus LCMiAC02]